MSAMQTRYPSSILEEELKNKVAANFFAPKPTSSPLRCTCMGF